MVALGEAPRGIAVPSDDADACARVLADVQAALDAQGIDRETRFGEQVFLKLLDLRLAGDSARTARSSVPASDDASPESIAAGLADWFGIAESQITDLFHVPSLDDGYPELRASRTERSLGADAAVREFAVVQAAAIQAIGAPPRLSAIRRAAAACGLECDALDAAIAASPHASLVGDSDEGAVFVLLDDAGLALARDLVRSWSA